ncbi:hypothetical protein B0A50_01333 [Salinomyces thailandicus]|uniref:Chromo domain-containing protein n=1 Tax=Salinomyces thailandicus TaxID=706561 RepID=A0A4U0UC55_9PEZI|nr:hypothetical protein B0A50_01333 [Salinomyces thailandica]
MGKRSRKAEIECIIGERRGSNGRKQFLAKWKDSDDSKATWEPASSASPSLVDEWKQREEDLGEQISGSEDETEEAETREMAAWCHGVEFGRASDKEKTISRRSSSDTESSDSALSNIIVAPRRWQVTDVEKADQRETSSCGGSEDGFVEEATDKTVRRSENSSTEESEDDYSDANQHGLYILNCAGNPPDAIIGERMNRNGVWDCFLVVWTPEPDTGQQCESAWVSKKKVPEALQGLWTQVKESVLGMTGGGERERAEELYKLEMTRDRLVIKTKGVDGKAAPLVAATQDLGSPWTEEEKAAAESLLEAMQNL